MTFTIELSEESVDQLKRLAATKTCSEKAEKRGEDFIPEDWAGGNFDDAYQLGYSDSDIESARNLLDLCGVEWKRS